MSKNKYAQYEQHVKEFFEHEGIRHLSAKSDPHGYCKPYFSHKPCDCCLAGPGKRYDARGYNPDLEEALDYSVCPDCIYYVENGQLDDAQMKEIEASDY